MDRLNNLASYFNEKERRRLESKIKENSLGIPEMTVDEIRLSCLENNGYETPELNDKLYLHFRGFRKIENLETYTGCRSIWLDSNGFDKIENLDKLIEIRCLYLAKNLISKIEGLGSLHNLTILDLSNNRLTMVENLSCCPILQTVNFAHNALSTPESIAHFTECSSITNIDITNNRLEANESFYAIFQAIPAVVTLSLNGNEITKLSTFRKRLIVSMPKLGYLDRPIDVQERLFAQAFISGGAEAETIARQQWKTQQAEKRVQEMQEFRSWQVEQQKLRDKAREEGRSLITELSPEEVTARAAEAHAAAEAEKALLGLGIDRLAAKYWKSGGDSAVGGSSGHGIMGLQRSGGLVDPLDEAARLLLQEQNAPVASEDVHVEVVDEVELKETLSVKEKVKEEEPQGEDEQEEEEEVVATEIIPPEYLVREDGSSPAVSAFAVVGGDKGDREKVEEVESQSVRDNRVAESLAIYKRQLQEAKERGTSSSAYSQSSTWTASAPAVASVSTASPDSEPSPSSVSETKESESDKKRPLYWSESMDVELGKLVKDCVFDFDLISARMVSLAECGSLADAPAAVVNRPAEVLTAEQCRLRWAQLDAAVWSDVSLTPSTSALDTVFKICINPSVLGAGHGAQPSFQALASIAAGAKPTYLTVPTSFPCVQDIEEDDVDSDLDLD